MELDAKPEQKLLTSDKTFPMEIILRVSQLGQTTKLQVQVLPE